MNQQDPPAVEIVAKHFENHGLLIKLLGASFFMINSKNQFRDMACDKVSYYFSTISRLPKFDVTIILTWLLQHSKGENVRLQARFFALVLSRGTGIKLDPNQAKAAQFFNSGGFAPFWDRKFFCIMAGNRLYRQTYVLAVHIKCEKIRRYVRKCTICYFIEN